MNCGVNSVHKLVLEVTVDRVCSNVTDEGAGGGGEQDASLPAAGLPFSATMAAGGGAYLQWLWRVAVAVTGPVVASGMTVLAGVANSRLGVRASGTGRGEGEEIREAARLGEELAARRTALAEIRAAAAE